MAYNDYRPAYEYLHKLGFKETNTGESHPFDRANEYKLTDTISIYMDAFWDFFIEITSNDYIDDIIPIQFANNEQLEGFINQFVKK